MKWRSRTQLHWLVVALAGLMALVVACFGVGTGNVARAAASDGENCYKVEDPTGTVPVNYKGLVLTLEIGTYPQAGVAEPNTDNAITNVQVDPNSLVTTGTIIVKGGSADPLSYSLGAAPPLHAPALESNGKWPTISYVQVCPDAPAYGRVEVTKVVTGSGAPPDQEFKISLTPESGPAIEQTIKGAGTLAFEHLNPGTYTLSEVDPGTGWTVTYSTTAINVVAGQTNTPIVTNTYTPGRVEVTKVVTGSGAPNQEFTIRLTPQNGPAIEKTITGAGTLAFEGLNPGTYTLAEVDPGTGWTVTYSSTAINVVAGQTSPATITNAYTPAPLPGRVEVTKLVSGIGAPNQMFTISLTPEGGTAITQTITGAGTLAFDGLIPGTYTLAEVNPGTGWTVTYSSTAINVVAGQTSPAIITNTYVEQLGPTPVGSVIVTKVVSGDPPSATYEIGLVGPAPATTEHWRTVTGAGELTFSGLAVGTYTVVERDPGSNYVVTISPKTVTVTNGGVARATVTNAYEVVESAAGSLPATGSSGDPTIVAAGIALIVGGTALAALSRRRKIS